MNNDFQPKPVSDCFHIYSNGKKINALFSAREDKILAMNMIAITSFANGVKILADQIMETHFHAIVSGSVSACAKFKKDMIVKLNIFINRKGRNAYSNGNLEVSMDPIHESTELKNKIIYVYRNALAAGFPMMPWKYEWGPGDIYFVNHETLAKAGKAISDIPVRVQRRVFHTNVALPQSWRVNEEGMILPHCYMDWVRVEKEFGNARVFIAFIHQKRDLEGKLDAECARNVGITFYETELRREAKDLCRKVYGRPNIASASAEERIAIARCLWQNRRTYSVSSLSRVMLVSKDILQAMLLIEK